ncbi:Uncharacterized membrane protein YckC, RDD family [Mesobacillus persicus]|uniref:Uncharacterized membrane protein YckC, RDD family n=1 Tax=Mesobacillus persicus TaxID=930146 RepID=A0A1H7XZ29_9BACI|nr:RDD family protein [Mesobacillus persicus]SEM38347.1 Uncharacterized membrane protein YckC, RDD family [Mesobacillus persicus]
MSYEGNETEGLDQTDLSESETVKGKGDEKPSLASNPPRYAGFWMRFWAYLLDLVVIGSVNRLVIYPVFRSLDLSIAETSMFTPIAIATAFTYYLYFVLMTKLTGQTLGKMVFGIKVIHLKGDSLTWGAILFREWIGRFISTTILIAYVVVAFLPKKQGLHDLFADTSVIHER